MEKDKKHIYKDFIKNARITLKYSKNYKGTLLTILIINLKNILTIYVIV